MAKKGTKGLVTLRRMQRTASGAREMGSTPLNQSPHAAKATKQDESYAQFSDIEKELRHYAQHSQGKAVLCDCGDPKGEQFLPPLLAQFREAEAEKAEHRATKAATPICSASTSQKKESINLSRIRRRQVRI